MFALACAVLVASSIGGIQFLWCTMRARPQLHCCCPPTPAAEAVEHDRAVAAVSSASCCEARTIGALPPAATAGHAPPTVVPAPLVAVLPLALWLATPDGDAGEANPWTRANRPRAGPEPPLYDLHRAYLN